MSALNARRSRWLDQKISPAIGPAIGLLIAGSLPCASGAPLGMQGQLGSGQPAAGQVQSGKASPATAKPLVRASEENVTLSEGTFPKLVRDTRTGIVFTLVPGGTYTFGESSPGATPTGTPKAEPLAPVGNRPNAVQVDKQRLDELPAVQVEITPFYLALDEVSESAWSEGCRLQEGQASPDVVEVADKKLAVLKDKTQGHLELAYAPLSVIVATKLLDKRQRGELLRYLGYSEIEGEEGGYGYHLPGERERKNYESTCITWLGYRMVDQDDGQFVFKSDFAGCRQKDATPADEWMGDDTNFQDIEACTPMSFATAVRQLTGIPRRIEPVRRGDDMPITSVAWYEVLMWCRGLGYVLPTEAQWEYAASGPDNQRYTYGNDELAGACNTARANDWHIAHSGSTKTDVSWCGVHDLGGNVAEWCFDAYTNSLAWVGDKKTNPVNGAPQSQVRSIRGGWFKSQAQYSRTSWRFYCDYRSHTDFVGFRPGIPTSAVATLLADTK